MVILRFLGSTSGRVVRVAAGLALIGFGVAAGGKLRASAVVGLLPLTAGLFDFCVLGPLFRLPFRGSAFRSRCNVS